MATLVQVLPQTTSTMLHNRTGSDERYSPGLNHHQPSRTSQKFGSTSNTGYRGVPPSGPVAPYAFTATPHLSNNATTHRSQQYSPTMISSEAPQLPLLNLSSTSLSNSTSSKSVTSSPSNGLASNLRFDDDSNATNTNPTGAAKSTPDRYRRNVRRTDTGDSTSSKPYVSAPPSGSGMAAVGQLYNQPGQSVSSRSLSANTSYREPAYGPSQMKSNNQDVQLTGPSGSDAVYRYRQQNLSNTQQLNYEHIPSQSTNTPSSGHRHTGSSESTSSGRSARSGLSSRPNSARNDSHSPLPYHSHPPQTGQNVKQDMRMVNTPNRHTETGKRTPSGVSTPSPLSRPMSSNAEEEAGMPLIDRVKAPVQSSPSPAAEQLAALNMKDAKKSKSKLRRAFSFGSAAELRKATAQANLEKSNATNAATKRFSRHEEELDPESARIAAKQEAGGLGESIYSGQGNFFTGSTDNLSISSTASSASLMLRKMGKGMKKGSRSLVGLFRPKSVIGVPAADGPVNQATAAQVSMVTVEAEREKVNVNLDPHVHQGGGTGFPKLERNSIDNKLSLDSGSVSTDTRSRQSIVGGERERAEVLAAVKKGILKRTDSNQSSPSLRPADKAPELSLPGIPHVNDSPRSSAPSTPKDDTIYRRTDSVTINDHHDDYFGSVSRFASLDSKTNVPITPSRNISFSPRIQFHDTWPSAEYDRRGEIATCNRLTPMLAQQIKEELNTFKMVGQVRVLISRMKLTVFQEMEVHESSKVYTHFF